MHITRQLRINKTEYLDFLSHEAGILYSKVLVTFKRVWRKHDVWLNKYAMQKVISHKHNHWIDNDHSLHSQTIQGIVDIFYDNIESWRKLQKTNSNARLPQKRRWYFVLPYKKSAIRLKGNKLYLSNGKDNAPIIIDWQYDKPIYLEISYNDGYIINAIYNIEPEENNNTNIAGIDLGEIHLAVAHDGTNTTIINGRELRSKRRYQNKVKGSFSKRLSKLKKGSRKHKQITKKKRKVLIKLDSQIKDILHKQTTKLIYTLYNSGVKTVVIGDVRHIRKNVDYGKHSNQKIHQMLTGKTRAMIEYKCERFGMNTILINEAYSSQTCPKCLNRHKPTARQYTCPCCGFAYHRDGVGAINIRQKQMYLGYVPVVGGMTPPIGIRYVA